MRFCSDIAGSAEAVLFHVEYDKIIQRREKKQEEPETNGSEKENSGSGCKEDNETSNKQN